jgi:hypothetical protein
MEPIWSKENGDVKCWVEARPNERGGRFRVLVTTPAKRNPGNGFPYDRESDAVQAAAQTFRAFDAIYNQ